MLDERKAAILRAVVEAYIDTAQPVGSSWLARAAGLEVSPATVRNEMAALEHEGLLMQPHTSAGRIPTEKGYRYFVDSLGGPGLLGSVQRHLVKEFFARAHGELEEMLAETSRLLSDMTEHTAVVVSPGPDVSTILSCQLVRLSPRAVLVVAVLSNGSVEKHSVELSQEVGEERIAAASAHLAAQVVGASMPLSDAMLCFPGTGDALTDDVTNAAVASLGTGRHEESEHVFVGGAARTAAAFDAVNTVREVLDILEHQLVIVGLLHDVIDRGLSVAIGSETGLQPLAECAVVVAPYGVEGSRSGTIGVLGPTRMNYPQAMAAVAAVSERLGRRLAEG